MHLKLSTEADDFSIVSLILGQNLSKKRGKKKKHVSKIRKEISLSHEDKIFAFLKLQGDAEICVINTEFLSVTYCPLKCSLIKLKSDLP